MGRRPCCSKEGMIKGAWTAIEDELLVECIKVHGEGKWSGIPKKAGLKRCGKSCRLRWLNYLRPDIKRGNMSPEEEDLIIRLHRLLGNRWSLIAGRIPGRTDNEIKNYWNTNFAKKAPARQTSSSEKNSIRITSPPSDLLPPNLQQFTNVLATPLQPELEFEALPPPMDQNFSKTTASEPQFTDNSPDIIMDLNPGEISVSEIFNDDFINFNDFEASEMSNIDNRGKSEVQEIAENWAASDCLDQAQYYMGSDFSPLAFLFESAGWVGDDDVNVV
ncbi:hypothetical protein PVL29_004035 [Vitis rotundifolia]|uniref:Uncharacterized protein n=1 Tax=Vitis rotundifolia TaxID=103349 RepID=A0AA39A7X9_VITRO|nr:hypothetical protein PVL29_004035 [Vitis rotundifolia]